MHKMMTAVGVLFLVIMFSMPGISDEPGGTSGPGIPDEIDRYAPFDLGSWKQYDRSYWSIPHGSAWVEEIIQTVVGTDVIFGKYPAKILKDEGVSYDSIWVVYVGDELRRYENEPKDYSDYKVLLKTPLEKGHYWPFSQFPVEGDTLWAFILEDDATIEVPAGTYEHCLHVFALPFYHYWFAPEIGIVRSSYAESDSLTGTDDDLMNYDFP